jgi:hypothetical protein
MELHDFTLRTIKVLRWRLASLGPHDPIAAHDEETWSFDGINWHAMPTTISARISSRRWLRVDDVVRREVTATVRQGYSEPVAHELYREAWGQERGRNLHGAMLLGISAAEVGIKQCIATLAPDTAWMVENIQTPPIARMLREYIPALLSKLDLHNKTVPPPDSIVNTIHKGTTIRNKITHGGLYTLTSDTVRETLLAVYDLLWILDYYTGHNWAIHNLRYEVLKAWLGPDCMRELGIFVLPDDI